MGAGRVLPRADGSASAGSPTSPSRATSERARSEARGCCSRVITTGVLHVFANACRHRGHELLPCEGATNTSVVNRGVVQCPYHAWSYELDGRLRLAPRFDAENFDPSVVALLPVRHAEWGGWLFVNVSGDASPVRRARRVSARAGGELGVRAPRRRRDTSL